MGVGIPRARAVRRCRRLINAPPGLPRCNWQFWDEPDETNHGPQIVVTEPNEASHYLVDLDTYHKKLRQRHERKSGQAAASYVEMCRMAARTDAMGSFSFEKMDMYGDDDESALFPWHTQGHSMRWWQRWGRMLLGSVMQCRPLLPMCHQADSPFDSHSEKWTLLGYHGAQVEKAEGSS
ncbi:hypothetical protein DHEL01_v203537 [Diaporthe helianthi]|uniref:Uncharacterized protein n=1 Tax=Diaporthe helianthi TaxID=158607 RepID=A0A2P5I6H9_DIAHE|nr:hypothetical protein DHEL01_v203537 [Diaporthe helianthi]